MKCPRCESMWTKDGGLGAWHCKDCGTVFGATKSKEQKFEIPPTYLGWVILVELQGKVIPITGDDEYSIKIFNTELDAKWFFSEHALYEQRHWIIGLQEDCDDI